LLPFVILSIIVSKMNTTNEQTRIRILVDPSRLIPTVIDVIKELEASNLKPMVVAKNLVFSSEGLRQLGTKCKLAVKEAGLKVHVAESGIKAATYPVKSGVDAIVFLDAAMTLDEDYERKNRQFSTLSSVRVMVDVSSRANYKADFLNRFFKDGITDERTIKHTLSEMPPLRHKVGEKFSAETSEVFAWMIANGYPKDYKTLDAEFNRARKNNLVGFLDEKWRGTEFKAEVGS